MIPRFPRIGIWIVILVALLSNCSLSDSIQEQSDFAVLSAKANSDDAEAQFSLGLMYELGQGVPQDYAEAVKWYRMAAEQGHAAAQFNLGLMYAEGQGVTQDHTEAVKWYRLAAEQGYAGAQYNLGFMYAKGQGVTQDYTEAHKWFNLAASQGTGAAHKKFAAGREAMASMMTPEQLAEAQLRAIEWAAKKKP